MSKKIKVLFLTQYGERDSPSGRQRVYQYLPLIREQGVLCTVSPGQKYRYFKNNYVLKTITIAILTTIKRFLDIFRIKKYDVIFFQREIYQKSVPPVFEWIYSRLNKNIIFDFDDAIYLDNRYIPKILGWSKEVIVGNNNLREYALRYNKNVTLLPTPLKEEEFTLVKKYRPKKKKEKVIIGWVGNVKPHLENLRLVKPVIKRLEEKYNIEFRIIGAMGNKDIKRIYKDVKCVKIIHSVEPKKLQNELIKFDIGIMPLVNNEWNAGKSGRKLLEYLAVGLATVSSPIGINADIIKNGKNGFSAKTEEEWYAKLEKLINDEDLRKRMGKTGRKSISQRYFLKPCSKRLIKIIKKVAKSEK